MAFVGGVFLRVLATVLRFIQLFASILVLGVYSYFLAILHDHDLVIARWIKGVEGVSGAAVLYGIFCVLLTLCLGGVSFFAFLAVVLDILFCGAYIAVAYYNRRGTDNCNGFVATPLGSGPSNANLNDTDDGFGFGKDHHITHYPKLKRSCELEKAVFVLAIINAILFVVTALFQIMLVRHHKREKRYGPSPANNYTSGFGRRPIWRRNRRARDAELAPGAEKISHDGTGNGYTHPTGTAVNY